MKKNLPAPTMEVISAYHPYAKSSMKARQKAWEAETTQAFPGLAKPPKWMREYPPITGAQEICVSPKGYLLVKDGKSTPISATDALQIWMLHQWLHDRRGHHEDYESHTLELIHKAVVALREGGAKNLKPQHVTQTHARRILKKFGRLKEMPSWDNPAPGHFAIFTGAFEGKTTRYDKGYLQVTCDGQDFYCNRKPISDRDAAALYLFLQTVADFGMTLHQRKVAFDLIAEQMK